MPLDLVLELQVTIDFTYQLWRILANTPGDIALAAEIGGNAQIVAIAQVDFDQVAVEDSGVNLTLGDAIEHLFGLHTIGNFDNPDFRVTILLQPGERVPEGRITVDHHRFSIQVTHLLYRFISTGDKHLLDHVIERHRKRHLLQAFSINRQIADRDVALALDQRRNKLGKIVHQHQFRNQPVRKRKFLGD